MDKVTLQRIQTAHPINRAELNKIYQEINLALTGRAICRFAYVFRTWAEQAAEYAKSRTAPGPKVTDAGPGESYHNYGLAVDIVLLKDTNKDGTFETASWETNVDFDGDGRADWLEVVAIFQKYGWTWGFINSRGQRWDLPHFQKTHGKTWQQLKTASQNGKIQYPAI